MAMRVIGAKSFWASYGIFAYRLGLTACVDNAPITTVYPSAGDFATKSAPMFPPAPGLFSTTTLCPQRSLNCCASRRPTASSGPPGGNGTISRAGFTGNDCANAAGNAATHAHATTAVERTVDM